MKQKQNKRGAIGILIFAIVLFAIVLIGFGAAIVVGIFDIVSDEVTPIMTELGMAGSSNISEYAEYGFGTLNTFTQAVPWLVAAGYIMALIFTIVFIFIVGYNPHPAFIAFYFALMILLVLGCILVSNMYQDIYTGTDELALRLQEQTIMSYMLLHSPFIMIMIMLIGGLLMFTRQVSSEGGGGFGV